MGLFDRGNKLQKNWIALTTESQIDDIIKSSYDKPQVIFKDSTSCGISAGVKHGLIGDWGSLSEEIDLHYLDLLSYRNVSNKVAEVSGIVHQSPQVIVYHLGNVVADTSHFAINVKYMQDVLGTL